MKSKRAREAVEAVENNVADLVEAPAKKRKRDDDTNGDGAEVKKAKKDKKDKKKDKKESRRDKKDKLKDILDLPEGDAAAEEEDVAMTEVNGDGGKKKTKKEEQADEEKEAQKKERREKKKDRKKEKAANKATTKEAHAKQTNGETTTTTTTNGEAAPTNGEDGIDLDENSAAKKDRHIVFVGNLPFSATAASISAHFASLAPIAVRCLKNKDDKNPCRGIAFVEFGNVAHMRTCLDKFHHSEFDDGKSAARKINVELTAGGGGKTKQRQNKIMEKNKKLDENRQKRIEKEKVAKVGGPSEATHMEEYIHPSRRARVPDL